jgi:hypothetical protein
MTHRVRKLGVLRAAAVGGVCAVAGNAVAAGEGEDDLVRRLDELQAKIAAYKAGESEAGWLTEERAREIRSLVADVIEDASQRRSLLADNGVVEYVKVNGVYGSGYYVIPGTDVTLRISGYSQVRYTLNMQDDNATEDTSRGGFHTRNRLTLGGEMLEDWRYKVQGRFTGAGDEFKLEDAYADYWCDKEESDEDIDLGVRAGQFRVPFLYEELVDDVHQLAVDRSFVNEKFTLGRSQGVSVLARVRDKVRLSASLTDGANLYGDLADENKNTPWDNFDTEFAITGRVDYFFIPGTQTRLRTFTDDREEGGPPHAYRLGGGIHYQKGESGTADLEPETTAWTIDFSGEGGGWNGYAAYIGGRVGVDGMEFYTQHGGLAQVGYRINNIEPFLRYEYVDFDDLFGLDHTSIVTGGFNYYVNDNVKVSADVQIGLDPIPFAAPQLGLRADANDEEDQFVIRTQLQLMF